MSYVIIGNSVAAVGAIEAIRKVNKKTPVVVISDEPYSVYSRPLISEYLTGQVEEEMMGYRDEDFYERNRVTTRFNIKAVSIDIRNRRVKIENGEEIEYQKLLLATGGVPFVTPIKGRDKEGVFTFTKLDDAKRLKARVESFGHVVVIGAGLIGLKAAESLRHRGVPVTVVELSNRAMATVLDEEVGKIIQNALESEGVEVITGLTVEEILGKEKVTGVKLTDRSKIKCDAVIIAIGVVPNTSLAKDAGIEVNRGIITDTTMRTNIPHVYAAGDVTEGPDYLNKGNRVFPVWPNAYIQGKIAGFNIAGEKREFAGGIAMNSIELFGVPIITAGLSNIEDEDLEMIKESEKNLYKKLVIRDERLVGVILVGKIDRAGIYIGLIREGINITPMKERLLANDFGYVDFPEELRKKKLGVAS